MENSIIENPSKNFETLSSTEEGARALIETIIRDYGAIDFLQCVFFNFNEKDQKRFLDTALGKAGAV